MAKSELLEFEGVVEDCLPSALFRVRLSEDHTVIAVISGKIRQNRIRILTGDIVRVEMSLYDLSRGRITYRNK